MMRHECETRMDFALVSALQLAERGLSIRERRVGVSVAFGKFILSVFKLTITTGYLYLAEMMPLNHEMGLLMINTIYKVPLANFSRVRTTAERLGIGSIQSEGVGDHACPRSNYQPSLVRLESSGHAHPLIQDSYPAQDVRVSASQQAD